MWLRWRAWQPLKIWCGSLWGCQPLLSHPLALLLQSRSLRLPVPQLMLPQLMLPQLMLPQLMLPQLMLPQLMLPQLMLLNPRVLMRRIWQRLLWLLPMSLQMQQQLPSPLQLRL